MALTRLALFLSHPVCMSNGGKKKLLYFIHIINRIILDNSKNIQTFKSLEDFNAALAHLFRSKLSYFINIKLFFLKPTILAGKTSGPSKELFFF